MILLCFILLISIIYENDITYVYGVGTNSMMTTEQCRGYVEENEGDLPKECSYCENCEEIFSINDLYEVKGYLYCTDCYREIIEIMEIEVEKEF